MADSPDVERPVPLRYVPPGAGVDRDPRVNLVNHRAQGDHLPADPFLLIERLIGDVKHEPILPAFLVQVIPEQLQTSLICPLVLGPQPASVSLVKGRIAGERMLAEDVLGRKSPAEEIKLIRHVSMRKLQLVEVDSGGLVEGGEVGRARPCS